MDRRKAVPGRYRVTVLSCGRGAGEVGEWEARVQGGATDKKQKIYGKD